MPVDRVLFEATPSHRASRPTSLPAVRTYTMSGPGRHPVALCHARGRKPATHRGPYTTAAAAGLDRQACIGCPCVCSGQRIPVPETSAPAKLSFLTSIMKERALVFLVLGLIGVSVLAMMSSYSASYSASNEGRGRVLGGIDGGVSFAEGFHGRSRARIHDRPS